MFARIVAPLLRLFGTNWITLFGASLTTASGLGILAFLLLGLLGLASSPYIALMALLVLPGVFLAGLILIPVGLFWERRPKRIGVAQEERAKEGLFPVIDLNRLRVRRLMLGVSVLTAFNVLLIAVVSYEGVIYMDSTEFCGQVCHTVMDPEFTAYQGSPHSRVECVHCHIGPGAPWFVRSKLSGVGQVLAVTFNTYHRPIPTPVTNLRPSQDTCEQCHWPDRFSGDRIKVIRRFAEDENNTPQTTVLVVHIGGGARGQGIHSWHINPDRQTTYVTADPQRQNVTWIQVKEGDKITQFTADGAEVELENRSEARRRLMDCIDCHNRPTHIFSLPGPALDEALAEGRIDRSIPFVKKTGVEVLGAVADAGGGAEQVGQKVRDFYREQYADFYASNQSVVETAIREIEHIYLDNIFPEMRLTWGSYPDNIGHQDFPGCFRCHDGEHSTADGKTIEQDCSTCHSILAWDEESPEVLQQLGLE